MPVQLLLWSSSLRQHDQLCGIGFMIFFLCWWLICLILLPTLDSPSTKTFSSDLKSLLGQYHYDTILFRSAVGVQVRVVNLHKWPTLFFCWGFIQYIPHFPHPALGVLFTLFVPLVVALKYRQILVRWLTQYGRFFFFLFQNQRHQPLIPPDLYSAFFSKFRPKSDRGPWGSCIPCLK